jgi:hypothetical protein
LLVGLTPSLIRSDILAFLPQRPVVDRLISRYFNAKEPSTSEFDNIANGSIAFVPKRY